MRLHEPMSLTTIRLSSIGLSNPGPLVKRLPSHLTMLRLAPPTSNPSQFKASVKEVRVSVTSRIKLELFTVTMAGGTFYVSLDLCRHTDHSHRLHRTLMSAIPTLMDSQPDIILCTLHIS